MASKSLLISFYFLLFILINCFSTSFGDDDVIVLTESNFDEVVNAADLILVEFYAPWCGHCKKLEPEYAQAATILKKNDPPILLAKVDATVHSNLASRFDVRGYPTMKIFRHGSESPYNGPRETNGIVSYMKKQVGPSAKPITSKAELDQFISDDVSVVGYFTVPNSDLGNTFRSAADALREQFRFGIVTDKQLLEESGFQQAVVLHKTFDEKKNVYTGSNNKEELINWVYSKSVPVAGEITKDNQDRYLKKNLPILKVYFDVDYKSNLKRTNYYLNRLKKVAEDKNFQNKLLFAIANKATFRDELDRVGLTSEEFGIVIDDKPNNLRYKYTGSEFNVQNLQSFVNDYINKKLKPYIKSQPVPESNNGPVTVVVGETFNDIVMDESKDVLIELYAPWCGHCKKLEPIYEELGKKVKKDYSNLVIAKMDATANDSPHGKYQANGYPTILFAPAGKKNDPMTYSGDREVKNFLDFLKSNGRALKKKKKDEL